ncbi:MAG: class I SAM-dependent methyltransferase [Clostridia bacterium]|nr:class I SAM-dependent methyltransferase [Clostridia bacterium]
MYKNLAYIYDKLMEDVSYKKWVDYVEEIFKLNKVKPGSVLDLGCGTGSFTLEMAKRGYEMIGVDLSCDMLSCARNKALAGGLDILFLNQDMTRFELYGTVDAVVCLMDSVNYITRKKDLKKMFRLVRNYLNPGGLFVFDVNTAYKLEKVLGNNIFYFVDDEVAYIWKNRFDRKTKICEFDLTFFVKEGDVFRRHDETHYERAYTSEELKELLDTSGLRLLGVYDEMKFKPLRKVSQRAFFVCAKP